MILKRKYSCNRQPLENAYLRGETSHRRFHVTFMEILLGIKKLLSSMKHDVITIRCWISF